jgi:hypothetical protein
MISTNRAGQPWDKPGDDAWAATTFAPLTRNAYKVFELKRNFWSERRDLNSGPPVPQTGALTGLRYAPNGGHYSGWG